MPATASLPDFCGVLMRPLIEGPMDGSDSMDIEQPTLEGKS
jgi:hypothetical protein